MLTGQYGTLFSVYMQVMSLAVNRTDTDPLDSLEIFYASHLRVSNVDNFSGLNPGSLGKMWVVKTDALTRYITNEVVEKLMI